MARIPIYRLSEVRALEAVRRGLPLMERAGLAAAEIARECSRAALRACSILAGPGNNGGDAFVVARWLKSWFFDVTVAFVGDAAKSRPDAAAALSRLASPRRPTHPRLAR